MSTLIKEIQWRRSHKNRVHSIVDSSRHLSHHSCPTLAASLIICHRSRWQKTCHLWCLLHLYCWKHHLHCTQHLWLRYLIPPSRVLTCMTPLSFTTALIWPFYGPHRLLDLSHQLPTASQSTCVLQCISLNTPQSFSLCNHKIAPDSLWSTQTLVWHGLLFNFGTGHFLIKSSIVSVQRQSICLPDLLTQSAGA